MRLLEHQAKAVLSRFGVPVPRGTVVETAARAAAAAESLGPRVVLKALVSAGSRGRAGGVRAAQGPQDARARAEALMKSGLVAPLTSASGEAVRRILVEEAVPIRSEFYLGAAVDRRLGAVVLLVSPRGGIEIEETARIIPAAVIRESVDPESGLRPFQARRLAYDLGLSGESLPEAAAVMTGVVRALLDCDATLVEVNPLALTEQGGLLALDAKIILDDNALFRHPEFQAMAGDHDADQAEAGASLFGSSHIRLGGDVGCLANGAGLTMATAELVQAAGGRPADFLDVGEEASEDAVEAGLEIILSDPEVRSVLVNIVGDFIRFDLVAASLIRAAGEKGIGRPFVIRFTGTEAGAGRSLLAGSGSSWAMAETMDEAARRAVQAARTRKADGK
jgi:succinyl-CoA synthetase beta subunit